VDESINVDKFLHCSNLMLVHSDPLEKWEIPLNCLKTDSTIKGSYL